MNYNKLLYGKSDLEKIVAIEPNDGEATLFIRENEKITTRIVQNKFWALSPTKVNNAVKLEGDLHFQWGVQFNTNEEFSKFMRFHPQSFAIYNAKEALMVKDGYTYFKGMTHTDLAIMGIDIEATTLFHDSNAKVLLIATTYRLGDKTIKRLFSYDGYSSQKEMIDALNDYIRELDPDVILAHNGYSYDFPYLDFIAKKFGTSLKWGRDGSSVTFNKKESKFRIDGSRDLHYKKCHIYGREIVDTMFLSYRYDIADKKYFNYSLKTIIKQENLENPNRTYYDASLIRTNYMIPDEWKKIQAYCIDDADDLIKLYDLMIPPFFYMTTYIPKPLQLVIESASGSQLNSMMIRSYLQEKHSIPKADTMDPYPGAISFGVSGIWHNALKVDVASLYPSIMMHYKIHSPEKDPKAHLCELIELIRDNRLHHKRLSKTSAYHENMQKALKVLANSMYGFLGTPGLNFNYQKGADTVTRIGREILKHAIYWASGKHFDKPSEERYDLIPIITPHNFTVCGADTDSIMFCKEDQSQFSEDEQTQLINDLNKLYPSSISWEHDGLYTKVIYVKAKNYILYDGKKLKYKGSSLKATTLEPRLQEYIKEMIQAILDDTKRHELTQIYNRYTIEACNLKTIDKWSSRKTISDKVLTSERTNELSIREAIEGTEIGEGDRIWVYYTNDGKLKLKEQFDGKYSIARLLDKLHNAATRFETILPVKEMFPNYALRRNQKVLKELVGREIDIRND